MTERSLEVAILATVVACTVSACGGPPASNTPASNPAAPANAARRRSAPSVAAAPSGVSSTPESSERDCGALECQTFATPREAFEAALASSPRVVAVGEAHAQKAVPGVESATKRFARDLLPLLAPRVRGVVLELLAPDNRCEAHEEAAVAKRARPVTEPQRDTNQSEFLALGFDAKKLGMRVEPLIPTCGELAHVLSTQNDVGALLELIANITVREGVDFLDHENPAHALLIYGGLVHNDLAPSPAHAAWSFGPRLAEHADGSYVEIDLIVPEFIRNEEPWSDLAWFSHYDRTRAGSETWLFHTGPASFALIFPPSEAPKATP